MMAGSAIYKDLKDDKIIVAIDDKTLKNESREGTVVLRERSSEPQTELEALTKRSSKTTTDAVDLTRSNPHIEVDADNYEAELLILRESADQQPLRIERQTMDQIVLPDTWSSRMSFPKWDRLCWEQQRAAYKESPWWYDIIHMTSQTPTPGWFEGEFDFPIEGFEPNSVPTEVFPLRVSGTKHREIDAQVSNISIEGAQSVVRDWHELNYKGQAAGGTAGRPEIWENWKEMDAEDEPELWVFDGKYDWSSWPVIDEKQIPLIPNRAYNHPVKTFEIKNQRKKKPGFILYWNDNIVNLYYYDTVHSETSKLRVLLDGKVIYCEYMTYSPEGTIQLGTFDTDLELRFIIQFWHADEVGTYSWIEEHVGKTKRPMCAETEIKMLSVSIPYSDDYGKHFRIKFDGVSVQKMYKAPSVEKAFVVDMTSGSDWLTNLQNRTLVGKLVVSKRAQGVQIPLGSFCFNPIGSNSSPDGEGGNITSVHNENGVFRYLEEDNTDGNYTIRFYPKKGDLRRNKRIDPEAIEEYEFRIAEWTLACEHGLRTGENFAYMTESPRFRYDSWDEEHPVRKWLRMSPVDPQFDSESRLSELSKSRTAIIANIGSYGSTSLTTQLEQFQILEQAGWKTIYAECAVDGLFGTWHSYDFKFKLPTLDSHVTRIELYASYLYPRAVQYPPRSNPKSNPTDSDLLSPRSDQEDTSGTSGGSKYTTHYTETTLEWTDIGNVENTVVYGEGGNAFAASRDTDGDGIPDTHPKRVNPQETHILSFSHSTDVLHVVDFVSYQKVFFLVWNWLNSLYTFNNMVVDDEPVGDQESEGAGLGGNSIPIQQPPLDPTEFYLTPENAIHFEEQMTLAAAYVDDWIRKNVRIVYFLKVYYPNGTVREIPLTGDSTWNGDELTSLYGQKMNFDMPEVVEGNTTWITAGIQKATEALRQYDVIGDGDGDGNDGDDNGGGRKPAPKTKYLDLNGVDPNKLDMAEKEPETI